MMPSIHPIIPMNFTRSLLFVALVGLFSASLAAKAKGQEATKAARFSQQVASSNSTTVTQCGCGCGCGCCGCGCCKRKRRDQSAVVKGNKKNTTSRFARIKRSLGLEEPEQTKIEKEEQENECDMTSDSAKTE
ncbi:hypothetical protein PRIPAC_70287 [Pristionchus pacificus]|uniref:Uncharacterized protein n=1 Tax=Pristionchus pacificus TaxID=54126 RepID=A0A2A6CF68_PRIPA|nr:hypothetical protein PRIPAC_70287 [Pristionchus pacificus]|eukprot:PDM76703.1 hypothetical protein PRIPAC_42098 [Pristionchus pacificus]